jgi:uncharacterized protein (DUF2267 family)
MKYEEYASEAHKFVNEIASELGEPGDFEQADRIMTAVFHTLRNILTPEESLHLISQLPMLIKAIYINGWHLSRKERVRSIDEFIESLMLQNPRAATRDFGNDEKAKERASAVFRVLRNHIGVGESKDVAAQLPSQLIELWLYPEEEKEQHSV